MEVQIDDYSRCSVPLCSSSGTALAVLSLQQRLMRILDLIIDLRASTAYMRREKEHDSTLHPHESSASICVIRVI